MKQTNCLSYPPSLLCNSKIINPFPIQGSQPIMVKWIDFELSNSEIVVIVSLLQNIFCDKQVKNKRILKALFGRILESNFVPKLIAFSDNRVLRLIDIQRGPFILYFIEVIWNRAVQRFISVEWDAIQSWLNIQLLYSQFCQQQQNSTLRVKKEIKKQGHFLSLFFL